MNQAGLNFKLSDRFGLSAGYNSLNLDVGEASLDLTMQEVLLHFHPFTGSFFIAGGIGKESLDVTATTASTSTKVSIEAEASTTIIKLGWMWGSANGGFWFGMDVSSITPSNPKQTITAPGVSTTSDAYVDSQKAADDFGKTAYTNITFARFGWLF